MSDYKEKKYADGVSVKEFVFESTGSSILKVGINVAKFAAFVKANKNAKGYINLVFSKRQTVGQYGETHSAYLDTYTPKTDATESSARQEPQKPKPVATTKQSVSKVKEPVEPVESVETDDGEPIVDF